jgi:hypothetical protein
MAAAAMVPMLTTRQRVKEKTTSSGTHLPRLLAVEEEETLSEQDLYEELFRISYDGSSHIRKFCAFNISTSPSSTRLENKQKPPQAARQRTREHDTEQPNYQER